MDWKKPFTGKLQLLIHKNMFNLEQSIAEWRRQMLAAGIQKPVPLEELESHLREEIQEQIQSGVTGQQAFEVSVIRIGEAALVKDEFKKIETTRIMKKIITIILALFAMVFGLGAVLPQLGQWSRTGILYSPTFLAIGVVLVITGGIIAFNGIRSHREKRGRRLLSLAIVAAGIFYAMPLILEFFQPGTHLGNWMFCIFLTAASVLFFGSCFLLNKRIPARFAE
jgi:cation transport ATPase